jgi:hypothetical protein
MPCGKENAEAKTLVLFHFGFPSIEGTLLPFCYPVARYWAEQAGTAIAV